jgi:hypothetical protein
VPVLQSFHDVLYADDDDGDALERSNLLLRNLVINVVDVARNARLNVRPTVPGTSTLLRAVTLWAGLTTGAEAMPWCLCASSVCAQVV